MSNLSDLLPSGAGGKSFDFVASGTLPNGRDRRSLRSDGKVEALAGYTRHSYSNEVTFESGASRKFLWYGSVAMTPATDDKFLSSLTFNAASTVSIGTMVVVVQLSSGTTYTFGTPVVWQ